MISAFIIYKRWEDGVPKFLWLTTQLALVAFAINLQVQHKHVYLRHRIQLILAMRYMRLLGFIILVDPALYTMLDVREASCGYILLKPLVYRVVYILTLLLGYQVLLVHQVWLILLNVITMSVLAIRQCRQAMEELPILLRCAIPMNDSLGNLGKLAPFSANLELGGNSPIEPWRACAQYSVFCLVSCIYFI